MKQDLSLSLLSRGCGQFVSSDRHEGGEDGRLDVCFTPQVLTTAASPISVASPSCKTSLWARRVSRSTYQSTGAPGAEFTCQLDPSSNGWYSCAHHRQDYYSWKSQDALLQLSNSGRLLAETQSAMPKTFSTRRGPLLLFSQVTCRLARLPNKLLFFSFFWQILNTNLCLQRHLFGSANNQKQVALKFQELVTYFTFICLVQVILTETPPCTSQYLVTLDASCPPEMKDRKRPVVRPGTQGVKEQLRTFKELTSAFLRRRNKQVGRKKHFLLAHSYF